MANTTAYLSFLYHGFTGTHLSSRAVSVIWSWWIWPMFTAPSVRSFFMPGRSSRVALLPGTFAKMRAQRVGLLQQNQRRPCPFAQRRQRLRRCHQLHRCRRIPRLACRRPLAQSCLSASPPLSPNCIRRRRRDVDAALELCRSLLPAASSPCTTSCTLRKTPPRPASSRASRPSPPLASRCRSGPNRRHVK